MNNISIRVITCLSCAKFYTINVYAQPWCGKGLVCMVELCNYSWS